MPLAELRGNTRESTPSSYLGQAAREAIRIQLGPSRRELQITLHIMDGLHQRDIARRLACSPHTVDSHIRQLTQRCGAALEVDAEKPSRDVVLDELFVYSVPPG